MVALHPIAAPFGSMLTLIPARCVMRQHLFTFFATPCVFDFMLLIDHDVAMAPQVQCQVLWVLCKHNSQTSFSMAWPFPVSLPAELRLVDTMYADAKLVHVAGRPDHSADHQ